LAAPPLFEAIFDAGGKSIHTKLEAFLQHPTIFSCRR